MKIFKEINDEDIFENPIVSTGEYRLRPTVKAIIVDEKNNVAILKARGHYLLPGGGIEKDENKIDALKREMMEEIGCSVTDIEEIGISNQFRNKYMAHYEVNFFVAKVVGEKGEPTTTQEDELKSIELFWHDKETVLNLLKSQLDVVDENEYEFCFNARSHFDAFQYFCASTQEVSI